MGFGERVEDEVFTEAETSGLTGFWCSFGFVEGAGILEACPCCCFEC